MIALSSKQFEVRTDSSSESHNVAVSTLDQAPEFASIAALPSNHNALALGFDFACGQRKFVGIGGPSGWGKTELLEHVSQALSRIHERQIRVWHAVDWAMSQDHATSEPILVMDDLQDALKSPRLRHLLRVRLEQRLRRGKPTMVCQAGNFSEVLRQRVISPSYHWHLAQILEPSPVERQCIAHQIAQDEGIRLHPSIEALIATHLNGNGRSMRGAMLRLKLIRSTWIQDVDFAEACGVLTPFLIGEDGWDPRDVAQEAVNHVFLAWPDTPPIGRRAVLAFALNQLIRLSEEDVAGFLRISTGQVYRHCRNVSEKLSCPHSSEFIGIVRAHVFAALADSAKWLD